MEKKKRRVKVNTKKWIKPEGCNAGKWIDFEFEGMFHCWGNEAVEAGESGFGNFTIGIVEDQDGQIHTINPNHIKFIN